MSVQRGVRLRARLLLLVAVLFGAVSPALAASGGARGERREFKILMDSRKIGYETYTRVLDARKGIERIEAQGSAFIAGRQLRSRQTLIMEAGTLRLQEYRLKVSVMGVEQKICICGVDDKVHFEVRVAGQEKRASPPTPEGLVVLDNLVVQSLRDPARRYDWKKGGLQAFHAAVPQVMQIIPLTARAVAAPRGRYRGKDLALRQLRVTVAGLVVNVLASPEVPGQLLAVEVPLQKIEFRRDGIQVVVAETSAAAGGFEERELALKNGEITLGGTLTLPDPRPSEEHALPAVVLVHGSGPNDRDETLGPNKPFRDLAHGLARHGIAVYRYDKRTFAAREALDTATLTLEDETISDAVVALGRVRDQKEIDPGRVYLAGHSLGGLAAPWIAQRDPQVAGIILLAGANLPLDEMILEQTGFLARRRGVAESAREEIETMRESFRRLRAGELPPDEVIMGAGVRYWQDILARDPLAALAKVSKPVLVLAGDKDYQVGPRHYERWLEACRAAKNDRCRGRLFTGLNHLFMPVTGESDGTEYQLPSRVAPEVIEHMAAWILSGGGRP
ncbi:MAG: alpha/beta fold hydrolase [Acidobacteriota bacterium]|nr:alpha/beta fold hydrolase [Acidobacteriota bacterium]